MAPDEGDHVAGGAARRDDAGKFTDDRPRALPFYLALNAGAADIIDRYANRNPTHYPINYSGLVA